MSLVLVLAAHSAQAQSSFQQVFEVPPFRGVPPSEFAVWDAFTSATGPNSPSLPNSTGNGSLQQTVSPGVIVSGSGNLYGISAPPALVLRDSLPFEASRVVLQTRVFAEVDLAAASVALFANGQRFSPTRTPLADGSDSGSSFGGAAFSTKWTWDLPAGINSFSIEFGAAAPHSSLDAVALDVRGPEAPPPTLTVAPLATNTVTASRVQIRGSVGDPASIRFVKVLRRGAARAKRTTPDPSGNWSTEVRLKPGRNRLTVRAVGVTGQKSAPFRLTVQRLAE